MKHMVLIISILVCIFVIAGSMGATAQHNDTDNDSNWGDWNWGMLGLGIGLICFLPIVVFIIAIAIGVWIYRDAEKRGKNGTLWLLVGLIGGLIGLIIWLIVRPPEITAEQRQAKSRDTRRHCPDCKQTIPFDANVCPYCNKKFGLI